MKTKFPAGPLCVGVVVVVSIALLPVGACDKKVVHERTRYKRVGTGERENDIIYSLGYKK